jgi:hypothetical protein
MLEARCSGISRIAREAKATASGGEAASARTLVPADLVRYDTNEAVTPGHTRRLIPSE